MKKLLALVLALVMTLSLCVTSNAAYAGEEFDYEEAVEVMTAVGVFQGDENGKFNPTGILTREQAAKIVTYMLLGKKAADALVTIAAPFADVEATRWSAGAIAYCYNEGILAGVGNGMFAPTAELTGLAFAKMMLTALGYDAEVEGLTGSQWSINAAKLALTVGLTDDLDDVALSAPMTREQAAQMAFNAEQATLVEYKDQSTITAGNVTITTQSKATDVTTGKINALGLGDDDVLEFCEKYATKLNNSASHDDFGRPATKWTWDKEEVGTYLNEDYEVAYTKSMDTADVKADLKDFDFAAGLKATFNGDANSSSVIASYANLAALTADGRLVEVYVNDDGEIDDVIVIQAIKAEVTAVNTTRKTLTVSFNDGASRNVVIDEDSDFYDALYGTVEEDDILAVCPNSAHEIVDLYVPTAVTGVITYVKSNNKQVTINGETVKSGSAIFSTANIDEESTVYLDKTGFAIHVESEESSDAQYIYVTNMWLDDSKSYGVAGTKEYVKGVTTEGDIVTLRIENPDTGATFTDADYDLSGATVGAAAGNVVLFTDSSTPNAVYEYTENKNDSGKYLLTVPTVGTGSVEGVMAKVTPIAEVKNTEARINNIYAATDVKFIYVTDDGDDLEAKVTDRRTIPVSVSYFAVTEEVNSKIRVTVVFVEDGAVNSDEVIFVSDYMGRASYKNADGKTFNGYKVEYYAAGASEPETMLVKAASSGNEGEFYTTKTDGEGFELVAISDSKKLQNITLADDCVWNNNLVHSGADYDLTGAEVIDTTDNGIDSVAALQNVVEDDDMTVIVSFRYNSDKEVETVYVMSCKSNVATLRSVTVNGKTAAIKDSVTATDKLTFTLGSGETTMPVSLNIVTDNADVDSVVLKYSSDAGSTWGTFTNGTALAAGTYYFRVRVTAEDGNAAHNSYVCITIA